MLNQYFAHTDVQDLSRSDLRSVLTAYTLSLSCVDVISSNFIHYYKTACRVSRHFIFASLLPLHGDTDSASDIK